jgi:hypothetical protein
LDVRVASFALGQYLTEKIYMALNGLVIAFFLPFNDYNHANHLGGCWYLLTQIEYKRFHKRIEYHYSILPEVFQVSLFIFYHRKQWSKDLLSNKGISINQHTSIARARGKGNDRN